MGPFYAPTALRRAVELRPASSSWLQDHPMKAPKKAATADIPALPQDEEGTEFSSFSTFTTAGECGNHMSAFPTIATSLSSNQRSTTYTMIGWLQALATGGADSLGPYDWLLNTASNCSATRNKTLFHSLHTCQAITFNGIGGTLAISHKGRLGPLCAP